MGRVGPHRPGDHLPLNRHQAAANPAGPHLPGDSNYYRPCLTLDGDHYNVWGSRHNAPPDVSQWWLQHVRIPRSRWDSIA